VQHVVQHLFWRYPRSRDFRSIGMCVCFLICGKRENKLCMFEHFCNIYNFNNKCCSPHSVFPMTGLLLSQFGISEGPRFRKSCKKPQILGKCNRKSCKKPLLQEEYPQWPSPNLILRISLSLSLSGSGACPPHPKKPTRQKTSHRRPRRAQSLRQNSSRFLSKAIRKVSAHWFSAADRPQHFPKGNSLCVAWPGEVSKGRTSSVNGLRV
jgi:hypothetical protein